MNVIVYDLSRSDSQDEYDPNPFMMCATTPRQAVIESHALWHGDTAFESYEARYGPMVRQTALTVACGNFCTWSAGREPTANETSAALANIQHGLES